MRATLIALLTGLVAVATVLALRDGGDQPETPAAAPAAAPAPASAAVATASPQPEPPLPSTRSPGAKPTSPAVAAAMPKPPMPEAAPRRSSFALSSDHQSLVQSALLASADHDQLERESRDDAWATEQERLIRQELARQDNAADFDVISVDCRQTLCAVEAFSYGDNGNREWVAAMDQAFKDTLGGAFDSINTAFPTQNGRAAVLTFLHRRPVEPRP